VIVGLANTNFIFTDSIANKFYGGKIAFASFEAICDVEVGTQK
jgi:hypothetical protein